jgi:hypothetical protein
MSFRPSQVRFIDEGWGQQDLEGEPPKGLKGHEAHVKVWTHVDADKDEIQVTSVRMLNGEMKDHDKMK